MAPTWPVGASVALLALLTPPAPAHARWDAPEAFVAAIEAAGAPVRRPAPLRLAQIPPGDTLALLAVGAVPAAELRRFVQGGGRLLLAVESPGDPAAAAFGVEVESPPEDAERLGGHPALRVVRSARPAFADARALVTNRAVALRAAAIAPTVRWPDGRGLLLSARLGDGDLMILGDASLLIDLMRPVGDNARLADTLARWLAAPGRPVHLTDQALALEGGPPPTRAPRPWAERINAALATASEPLPAQGPTPWALLLVLTGLAVAYALHRFPGHPPPPPVWSAEPERRARTDEEPLL